MYSCRLVDDDDGEEDERGGEKAFSSLQQPESNSLINPIHLNVERQARKSFFASRKSVGKTLVARREKQKKNSAKTGV
jgi:hypothetical protein